MRRTKEEAEQTRQAILDAAVNLFADQGYAYTSLEQIAKAAEVTRGAIYWHFKNKAEIYDALHEQMYQPVTSQLLQDLELDHSNPLRQLEDTCVRLLIDLERDSTKQKTVKLFLGTWIYSADLTEMLEKHRAKKEQSLSLFAHFFERAQHKALLSASADTQLLTLSLRCYMKGIIVEFLDNPASMPLQQDAAKLISVFFHRWRQE